jgi:hypothetical protein
MALLPLVEQAKEEADSPAKRENNSKKSKDKKQMQVLRLRNPALRDCFAQDDPSVVVDDPMSQQRDMGHPPRSG